MRAGCARGINLKLLRRGLQSLASIILGEDQTVPYKHGHFSCWVRNDPPGSL